MAQGLRRRRSDVRKQLVAASAGGLLTAAGMWLLLRPTQTPDLPTPDIASPESQPLGQTRTYQVPGVEPLGGFAEGETSAPATPVPPHAEEDPSAEGSIPNRIEFPIHKRAPDVAVNVVANLIAAAIVWLTLRTFGVVKADRTLTVILVMVVVFFVFMGFEELVTRQYGERQRTWAQLPILIPIVTVCLLAGNGVNEKDSPAWFKTLLFPLYWPFNAAYDWIASSFS
jgi:hypothetical protein